MTNPPAPVKNIFDTKYLVVFPKDSGTLDEAESEKLEEQLKGVFSVNDKGFTPPDMSSHYLVIQGCSAANEDASLALTRARFVREVLKSVGLPDNKMQDLSVDDGENATSSVLLYFISIQK